MSLVDMQLYDLGRYPAFAYVTSTSYAEQNITACNNIKHHYLQTAKLFFGQTTHRHRSHFIYKHSHVTLAATPHVRPMTDDRFCRPILSVVCNLSLATFIFHQCKKTFDLLLRVRMMTCIKQLKPQKSFCLLSLCNIRRRRRRRRRGFTSAGQCLYARIIYSKLNLMILILISNF